jgi:steroid delta-isomerase-like uncharacterized protein
MRIVTLIAIACFGCAGTARSSNMTIEQNKQRARSIYDAVLTQGQTDLLQDLISPDFVGAHGETGPAGFATTIAGLRAAFPDIRYTVEDVVAEGDRVVLRWRWEGTHRAAFRGFAPTGKRVSDSGISIYQLRDGKIIRAWLETNRLGFLQQIGVIAPDAALRSADNAATKPAAH